MTHPWDREPGEPNLWYDRFDVYRLLGPRRSIVRAFEIAKATGELRGESPGSNWYSKAKRWRWKERAEAWDESERERLRLSAAKLRADAQNRRLDMVQVILEASYERLLPLLQREEEADIRALRLVFRDAIEQHRKELPPDPASGGEGVAFTADDLLEAQRQLEQWRQNAGDAEALASLGDWPGALCADDAQLGDGDADTLRAVLCDADANRQILDLIDAVLIEIVRNEHPLDKELGEWLTRDCETWDSPPPRPAEDPRDEPAPETTTPI